MGGVGRCEAAHLHQALALERGNRTLRTGRARQSAQRLRLPLDQRQQFALARTEFGRRQVSLGGAKRQQHKAPVQGATAVHIGQVGLQQRQDFGVKRTQQRHRHDALRAKRELALRADMDFAVTPQADGAHVDGAHHGAPATHFSALLGHLRPPVQQDPEIGGGAAHVGQNEALQARQPLRADQACRRAGQHGFDRSRGHAFGQREGTVALDDHERAGNLQLPHGPVHSIDQGRNAGYQARIQGRRQGAARCIQRRRKLGGQRHRLTGARHDQVTRRVFVRGIAHRKSGGHGECIHLAGQALQGRFERGHIERYPRLAVVVVPTRYHLHRHTRKGLGDTGALDHRRIEADQKNTHGTAVPFDHGIRGQRGGYRHQADVLCPQTLRQLRHGLGDGLGDTDSQVTLGGDGLGARHHLVAVRLDHGRVGIGAAGVDADQVGGGRHVFAQKGWDARIRQAVRCKRLQALNPFARWLRIHLG